MTTVEKYNLDLLSLPNILGVTFTTNGIRYRLGDLKYVQYLDLADLKVVSKKICRERDDEFDREFYHKQVEYELYEWQSDINECLFVTYREMYKTFINGLQIGAIIKYLNVFTELKMYDRDIISREIGVWLLELLFDKHVIHRKCEWPDIHTDGQFKIYEFTELDNEEKVLIRSILTSVFLNSSTVNCLISDPSYQRLTDFMFSEVRSCDAYLLSDIFRNQELCPVLSCVFTRRKSLLKALLNLGMKKREYLYMIFPHHNWLSLYPVYSMFNIVSDYGRVRLPSIYTTRDHLIFEVIIILELYTQDVTDVRIMRDCIRIIYQTVSYPYITASELGTKLNDFIPQIPDDDINAIIGAYRRFFPEIIGESCPRTLKHICRCKVRDCLGNQNLEAAISKLQIPDEVAKLLNLEDNNFPPDDFDEESQMPFSFLLG